METVLVTGAARRLGALIAEDLSASGCFVWIHFRNHEKEAYLLKDEIIQRGGSAECVFADLTNTGSIDAMLARIRKSENNHLTTIINNASIIEKSTIMEAKPEDWDRLLNTNLKAVWYLSTQFAKTFQTACRIITIGDASVSNGFAGHALYGLSKFALKYLNQQLAAALAPKIRSNIISPGLVLKGDGESDDLWDRRQQRTLLNNSGIIEEVLHAVEFLMADPGMTGGELMIDNGLHLSNKNEFMM